MRAETPSSRRFSMRAALVPWRSALITYYSLLITLVGWCVRIWRLDGQSLWYDEGVSLAMVWRTPAEILRAAAADIHPPLYYLVLRGWTAVAGTSEFSARFISTVASAALVPVTWAIGLRLTGSRYVAGLAALFVAISPLLVYYAQEARTYALTALLASLSILFLLRLLDVDASGARVSRRAWIGLGVVLAATFYTHYLAIIVLVCHVALIGIGPSRPSRGFLIRWTATVGAAAATLIPWLVGTLDHILGYSVASFAPATPPEILWQQFIALAFGVDWVAALTTPRAALILLLLGASLARALVASARGGTLRRADWVVWCCLVGPILAIALISLRRPAYNPRFLLLTAPWFALAAALGAKAIADVIVSPRTALRSLSTTKAPIIGQGPAIGNAPAPSVSIPRNQPSNNPTDGQENQHLTIPTPPVPPSRAGKGARGLGYSIATAFALFAIAHPANAAIAAYFTNPKYARDNYRGLAQQIQRDGRPGDLIILDAPGQVDVFGYYYRGTLPIVPLPRQRPINASETKSELGRYMSGMRRVWLVLWATSESDPNGVVESWIKARGRVVRDEHFGTVHLELWEMSDASPPER